MTSATLSPPRAPAAEPVPRGSVVLAGVVAASWVVALSWAVLAGLAIVGWTTAGSAASAASALRFSSQLWLLVQHVPLHVGGVRPAVVSIAPLGVTAGIVALLYRAGIAAARQYGARTLADCTRVAFAVAVPYSTAAVVDGAASRTTGLHATLWIAAVVPGATALGVSWLAAVRHVGMADGALARVPVAARAVARHAIMAYVAFAAASAVLLGVAAVLAAGRIESVLASSDAGAVGTALLALASVACIPNGVAWAGSYALGGGVGAGHAAVSPLHVTGGALPAVPPLAALPQTVPAPYVQGLVALLPLVVLVIAWRMETAAAAPGERWWWRYVRASGLAVGVGLLVAGAAALSGGSLGGIGMGPWPARDGALAAAAAIVAAFAVATVRVWQMDNLFLERVAGVAGSAWRGALRPARAVRARLPQRKR